MALLINLCIAVIFILLFLWLLQLVLARLSLPADVLQIVHVLVAIVVVAMMLGWATGYVPGVRPFVVVPSSH